MQNYTFPSKKGGSLDHLLARAARYQASGGIPAHRLVKIMMLRQQSQLFQLSPNTLSFFYASLSFMTEEEISQMEETGYSLIRNSLLGSFTPEQFDLALDRNLSNTPATRVYYIRSLLVDGNLSPPGKISVNEKEIAYQKAITLYNEQFKDEIFELKVKSLNDMFARVKGLLRMILFGRQLSASIFLQIQAFKIL